jgi:hypothetical protein
VLRQWKARGSRFNSLSNFLRLDACSRSDGKQ